VTRTGDDDDNHPTQVEFGTADDVGWTYAWNPAGRIREAVRTNDSYAFAPANISTAYAANGLNQYSAAGGIAAT